MKQGAGARHDWIDGRMQAAPDGGTAAGIGEAGIWGPALLRDGAGFELADSIGSSTSVRPGRVRSRVKTGTDEKIIKKPADGARKKSPPARKAPTRGRYVDEYARPAG